MKRGCFWGGFAGLAFELFVCGGLSGYSVVYIKRGGELGVG